MKKEIIIVILIVLGIIYWGLTREGKTDSEPEKATPVQKLSPEKSKLDKFIQKPKEKSAEDEQLTEIQPATEEDVVFPPSMVLEDGQFPERVPPEQRREEPPAVDDPALRDHKMLLKPPVQPTTPEDLLGPGEEHGDQVLEDAQDQAEQYQQQEDENQELIEEEGEGLEGEPEAEELPVEEEETENQEEDY